MAEEKHKEEGLFDGVFLEPVPRGRDISKEEATKQETEHSCRLADPDDFDTFRRGDCDQRSDGKCIDIIYGIKTRPRRRSTIQALRYPPDVWSASEARAHCRGRKGRFTAGRRE